MVQVIYLANLAAQNGYEISGELFLGTITMPTPAVEQTFAITASYSDAGGLADVLINGIVMIENI